MADPAPTRRSSRTSPTPVQVSSETPGASRAELRRRASAASALSAALAPAAVEVPVTALPIVDAVAAATPLAAASVSPVTPAAASSRRARRMVTAEQPAVAVPPISPVAPAGADRPVPAFSADLPTTADPAPLIDAVLTPAEPFELLEPVIEAAEPVAEAAEPAAEDVEVFEVVAAEPVAASRPSRRQRTPRSVQSETDAAAQPAATLEADDEPAEQATESDLAAEAAASDVDEFEAAARLFSFTGEVFVQTPADTQQPEAEGAAETPAADEDRKTPHLAPRKSRAERGAGFKRLTAASFSVGVMGIVGLMTVSMTTPAEAVAAAGGADIAMSIVAPGSTTVTEVDADEIQAYVAPAGAEAATLNRAGSYGTATTAELASQAGIRNFSNLFHNDPNAAIQWPFSVGVTMSYGFGMRSGRMHEGIDFTPGAGSPIQAIADGTVRVASEAGGAYGVHVIIDHMIDGQLVSSHYAHMQYGSLQVVPGQQVTVGTVLGRTGNTGRSYGAHTHFEILMNGTTPIDPMPWLREHAGG